MTVRNYSLFNTYCHVLGPFFFYFSSSIATYLSSGVEMQLELVKVIKSAAP